MSYPTLEQYRDALQHPGTTFADSDLQRATIKTSGLGLPLALCGGFALTYTATNRPHVWAVRCFHKESKALEERYKAISKRLQNLKSPYFLDFTFQPQGIRVEQKHYPLVKMAWASGETLGEFLEANYRNKAALTKLRNALQKLGVYLHQQGIAHGDIQTGNVMVAKGGDQIQLIDYDGMFLDELRSLGSTEWGHRNFQHPARSKTTPYDASLDRFSLIALTMALRALEESPDIWNKAHCDIDGIVFRANDFDDPQGSAVFRELASRPSLSQDIKNFAAVCEGSWQSVPTLEDFLSKRNIPASQIDLSGAAPKAKQRTYLSVYPVLNAKDYDACLIHVGNCIELIGRIIEVKEDDDRRGKPYIFVNFGPWRGRIVKINVWADGLAKLRNKPDSTWIGKWISVVGLMEPPYTPPSNGRHKYKYTHLAITISQNNQITIIDEHEAQFRLAGVANTFTSASAASLSKNTKILEKLGTTRATGRTSHAPLTTNQALLSKMKHGTGIQVKSSSPQRHSGARPTSGRRSWIGKIFDWIFK